MLTAIRRQLLTNWHPMRWVALAIGLFLGYNWLAESSPVLGFMSLFFLFQAVTNTGCLAGQCSPATSATATVNATTNTSLDATTTARVAANQKSDDIQFEEIKNRP